MLPAQLSGRKIMYLNGLRLTESPMADTPDIMRSGSFQIQASTACKLNGIGDWKDHVLERPYRKVVLPGTASSKVLHLQASRDLKEALRAKSSNLCPVAILKRRKRQDLVFSNVGMAKWSSLFVST